MSWDYILRVVYLAAFGLLLVFTWGRYGKLDIGEIQKLGAFV